MPPAPGPGEGAGGDELAWRVHLAAEQGGRAVLLLTVIVIASAWSLIVFGHPVAMAVTALLLVAATSEFLLPVRYRLTEEFAEARGPLFWRRIEWKDVRRVYTGRAEIKLSPLPFGGPREAFRGVVLRTADNQEEVLAAVRRRRAAAGAGAGADTGEQAAGKRPAGA